jgi:hypothetical protein
VCPKFLQSFVLGSATSWEISSKAHSELAFAGPREIVGLRRRVFPPREEGFVEARSAGPSLLYDCRSDETVMCQS